MGLRTGEQYVHSLKTGARDVWANGKRVEDVTSPQIFGGIVSEMARLYDLQHDAEFRETVTTISPSGPIPTALAIPRTREELRKRRNSHRIISEASFGQINRSADSVQSIIMGLAESVDFFSASSKQNGQNLTAFYDYVCEHDLLLTYSSFSPSRERVLQSEAGEDAELALRVMKTTSDGIVVSGARMLATLAPIADEILIYSPPARNGNEAGASVFAVSAGSAGLRQFCREPYSNGREDLFDRPLSARFEEPDSMLVFDNVLVPWERIFLYNDVDLLSKIFRGTGFAGYGLFQDVIRGLVKMQFITGVAIALAESAKTNVRLHVQEMLGTCVQQIELVRSCLVAAEAEAEQRPSGAFCPAYEPLWTAATMMSDYYPWMVGVVQKIGSGSMFTMPSHADLASPLAESLEYLHRGTEAITAVERVSLYKLAWDLIGSSFGAREMQYERYYGGDPVQRGAQSYWSFDTSTPRGLVEGALVAPRAAANRPNQVAF